MIANRIELADIFGVATTTIDAWRKRGCPVIEIGQKGKPSKYDAVAVVRWYKGGSQELGLQEERAKLAVEQTRKIKRENYLTGHDLCLLKIYCQVQERCG